MIIATRKKLKNISYYTTILFLFLIIITNIFIINKRPAKAVGIPIGGRFGSAIPCIPVLAAPNPVCTALGCLGYPPVMGSVIIPIGGPTTASTVCFNIGTPTMGLPITPASVGMQIAGEAITLYPVTTSINIASAP